VQLRTPYQRLADRVEQAAPEDREAVLYLAATLQMESFHDRVLTHLSRAAQQSGLPHDEAKRVIRRAILAAAKAEAAK
jgi:hypothetical protein